MIMVRLPHGVKDLFANWLTEHFPDRRNRVLGLIRDVRNGAKSNANFLIASPVAAPWR